MGIRSRTVATMACGAGIVLAPLALPALTSASTASATPITIMNISQITDPSQGQPTPEAGAGVQAAAKAINAAGGIKGHPIKVIVCNDADTSSTAANCANEAVSDKVVATVGDNSEWGTEIVPILKSAGIASIGSLPVSIPDFSSSNSFPVQPGGPGSLAACGYLLAKLGATNIAIARVDNPAAAELTLFANLGLKSEGSSSTVGTNVPVPPTAVDMSSYVAGVSGSNGLIIAMEANQGERFVQALHQAGYSGKVCTSSGILDGKNALKNLGSAANGMYIAGEFQSSTAGGPGWKAVDAGMKKYAAGQLIDDYSVNSWVATEAFATIAKTLPSVTAASVVTGFTNAKDVSTQGMTPPITATPLTLPAPFGTALSQLINPAVSITKLENGKETLVQGKKFLVAIPTGKYVNPS